MAKEFNNDVRCEFVMEMSDMMQCMQTEWWKLHTEAAGVFKRRNDQLAVQVKLAKLALAMDAMKDAMSAMQEVR